MTDARCDPQLFREVVGRFASGVAVITTSRDGDDLGMTASAMCSLSLEPPMVLVCVNRRVPTRAAVSASGVFAVNILEEDQAQTAIHFATPQADKFAGVSVTRGVLGCPLLDGALAWLECRVAEEVAGGSHSVFFGAVERARARGGNPLAYFRGNFGQLYAGSDDPVAAALREHLLDAGEDGGPLDARRLAAELGTVPGQVERALSSLVAEGLVSHDRDRGYVLLPLSVDAIDEVFDARCAIELGAAELALARLDEDALAELRADMERTRPLIQDGRFVDVRAYARANARFHETLVRLAGSPLLLHAYRRLSLPGILMRALNPSSQASDALIEDHVAIVEAYEARRLAAARDAIRRHTERTKETHKRALDLIARAPR
ncbi:MAG: 4-nitrophenol 2-monooxygenase / 4-nitrocatechol 4-monooxygenase, reductase component [Solirubrobacteraceae bacterium]|jgi:flavin reductase (DIM6/NTAB) family NADH-FMN oxidoreductase RutF/DNA-binding GntR family transcriptional regulator|nr:4-nitrophenol 2-monooxygenase / 4-nitrocatechol 4-monooxygenase, reductase component [Solirubrobacteraceae bacterium]